MPPMIGWSLEMVLDPEQELFKLARIIDWSRLEAEFGGLYCPGSRPCVVGPDKPLLRNQAGIVAG